MYVAAWPLLQASRWENQTCDEAMADGSALQENGTRGNLFGRRMFGSIPPFFDSGLST